MTMMTDIVLNDDSETGDFSYKNIVVYDKNDNNDGDDDDGYDDDNNNGYYVGDDPRPPWLFLAFSDSLFFMI